jgi:hypothetical protein
MAVYLYIYRHMRPKLPLPFTVAVLTLLASCTPIQNSSMKFSGDYTMQAISAEKK